MPCIKHSNYINQSRKNFIDRHNTNNSYKSQQFKKNKIHLHSNKYFKETLKSTRNFLNTYKYNELMQIASLTNIETINLVSNIQTTLIIKETIS